MISYKTSSKKFDKFSVRVTLERNDEGKVIGGLWAILKAKHLIALGHINSEHFDKAPSFHAKRIWKYYGAMVSGLVNQGEESDGK